MLPSSPRLETWCLGLLSLRVDIEVSTPPLAGPALVCPLVTSGSVSLAASLPVLHVLGGKDHTGLMCLPSQSQAREAQCLGFLGPLQSSPPSQDPFQGILG